MTLTFEINDNKIVCDGDYDLLMKNRNKIRLESYGYKLEPVSDGLFISHKDFPANESYHSFYKLIKKSFEKKAEINFGEDLSNKVENEIKEEEAFIEFKEKAKEIWFGDVDKDELNEFANVLKTKLTRRLYDLQLKSAYHLAFSQNSCNFSVPGAGKTSIVYGAYAYLKNTDDLKKRVNKLVVFGPPSSFDAWEDEFNECFGRRIC